MEIEPVARKTSHYVGGAQMVVAGCFMREKLGSGLTAAVWKAVPGDGGLVAIKVYRDDKHFIKHFKNELSILNSLSRQPNKYVIQLLDSGVYIDDRKDVKIHPYLVFPLYSDVLSSVIKYYNKQHESGLPEAQWKLIMRQLFTAIDFLHSNEIIHTDIKPSNILINKPCDIAGHIDENLSDYCIALADLGTSSRFDDNCNELIGTTEYMAPEVIIGQKYDSAVDIWAAFNVCYRLITGEKLFDVYAEGDTIYGDDVDCEALDGLIDMASDNNCDDICEDNCEHTHEHNSNDSSTNKADSIDSDSNSDGDEAEISESKIYYRHLLLITKILGFPPTEFAQKAYKYFNRRNRPNNNPDIVPTTISAHLHLNSEFEHEEAQELENFLLLGLKYLPRERCSAREAANHPLLALCANTVAQHC